MTPLAIAHKKLGGNLNNSEDFQPSSDCFLYYDHVGGFYICCECAGFFDEQCVKYISTVEEFNNFKGDDMTDKTYTQEMADEGVLPGVGMECEFETTFFTHLPSNTGTGTPIAYHANKVWFSTGKAEFVINLDVIKFKPLTPPKTKVEIDVDLIIDKVMNEMEMRFELKSNHDDSLVSEDTQLGVEFAVEFMRIQLVKLLTIDAKS